MKNFIIKFIVLFVFTSYCGSNIPVIVEVTRTR